MTNNAQGKVGNWTLIGQAEPLAGFVVQQWRLPNGLVALLAPDHSVPVFHFKVYYNIGSASEAPGKRGLAHLFEHMMFRETEHLQNGEYDVLVSRAGGHRLNASTWLDWTNYYVSLPRDKLDFIAGLEAERMSRLRITAEQLDAERGAVLGELKMYHESPQHRFWDAIWSTAYTTHPYRYEIIGSEQEIRSFTVEDCINFYDRYYAPNNAAVVVAGDIEVQEALHTLERHFGGIPSRPVDFPPRPAEPPQTHPREKVLHTSQVSTPRLALVYHIPDIHSPDMAPIKVLESVLAGGRSARLYRRLVEQGLAIGVQAGAFPVDHPLKDPGLLLIMVTLAEGHTVQEVLEATEEEIVRLRDETVPAEEQQRAVNGVRLESYQDLRTLPARAAMIGQYYIAAGDPFLGFRLLEEYARVPPEEVRRVADLYLRDQGRTVVQQLPE